MQRISISILLLFAGAEAAQSAKPIDEADAIVFGEIQSGQQTGTSAIFNLLVEGTIKGGVQSGSLLSVTLNQAYPNLNRKLSGYFGICFLKKGSNGTWTLGTTGPIQIEGAYLSVPKTPLSASATNSVQLAPDDQIASVLMPVVLGYKDVQQLYPLASTLLALNNTPITLDIYRRLADSPDAELHFIGLAGLSRTHDSAALSALASNVGQIASLKLKRLQLPVIRSLGDGDPDRVRALGKLSTSSDFDIQFAAAQTLEFLHSRDTMPFLAALLDSADRRVRQEAIIGMSSFVNNLSPLTEENAPPSFKSGIPSGPAPYKTLETDRYAPHMNLLDPVQEMAYVQFWKPGGRERKINSSRSRVRLFRINPQLT